MILTTASEHIGEKEQNAMKMVYEQLKRCAPFYSFNLTEKKKAASMHILAAKGVKCIEAVSSLVFQTQN